MPQNDLQVIDEAVKRRLLTKKQAELIREEMSMFPGEAAGNLMLRRMYVTEGQLRELNDALGGDAGGSSEPVGSDQDATIRVASAAPAAPKMPLSVAELRRQQGGLPAQPVAAAQQPAVAPPPQRQPPTVPARPAAAAAPAAAAPAPAPAPAARPAATGGNSQIPTTLPGLLRLARHWNASDLHISVGRPPFVRLGGQLRYLETDALTSEGAEELVFSCLTPEQVVTARENQQLDFALEIPKVGRHRCNLFKQRLGWDGAFRIIRANVPTLEELGLPPILKVLTEYNQGMVLVTGSSGAGKSTTAAALVDLVNSTRRDHIITVEDPVEFVMQAKLCQMTQREVGRHTESFAKALRAALREDPDIIMIGELRDFETVSIAISAAETGHLVFGTLPTSSAARTVARLVDFYPIAQQSQVSTMVAESLRGVITQNLVPRKDGTGQALALEILMVTPGVSQQIKEGKTQMITSLIQSGKRYGMMLMDDSLMKLYKDGIITGRDAYKRANNKIGFEPFKEET